MTQIVEDGNYLPSTPYTLSGTGITTTTASSPASGDWDISTTFGDIPVTARLIQLEYGNVASLFDLRPIASELALCQRYYQTLPLLWLCQAKTGSSLQYRASAPRAVEMRANPTITVSSYEALTGANAISDKTVWRIDAGGAGTGNSLASGLTADAEL